MASTFDVILRDATGYGTVINCSSLYCANECNAFYAFGNGSRTILGMAWNRGATKFYDDFRCCHSLGNFNNLYFIYRKKWDLRSFAIIQAKPATGLGKFVVSWPYFLGQETGLTLSFEISNKL